MMLSGLKPYPKMKDSGVEWLGAVPEHWEVAPIARIGQLFKGRGGSKEDEETSGVPCVRYGDLYTRHEFFINSTKAFVSPDRASSYTPVRYGDVLFAASGETVDDIGRSAVNLLDHEAVCGGDVILLRPNRDMNSRFLGYAADAPSSRHQKATMGRGFTVVHIYGSELKRLALAIPPADEQCAIVRFLDHADARIRRYIVAKQKLIKLLEEEKQAIIHRAVTRGLNSNVHVKPSGVEWLGDVPEHWEVQTLRKLVQSGRRITYGIVQPGEPDPNGVPMVRGKDYSNGWAPAETFFRATKEIEGPYKRSRLQSGDIVMTIVGAGVGNVAIVPDWLDGANITQTTARIAIDLSKADRRFIHRVLGSPVGERNLERFVYGAAQPRMNLPHVGNYVVPVPPLKEQAEIVEALASTPQSDVAVARLKRQLTLVAEYRTRLIEDIVTGKLDVREAAAKLPDVVPEGEGLDESEDVSQDEESAEIGELEAEEAA